MHFRKLIGIQNGKIEIDERTYGLCNGQEIPNSTSFVEFDNLMHPSCYFVPTATTSEVALTHNFNVYRHITNKLSGFVKFVSDFVLGDPPEITNLVYGALLVSFTYKAKWKIECDSGAYVCMRLDTDTDSLIIWQHKLNYSVKYEYHLKDHVYIPLLAESSLPDDLCILILKYI
jgi:hypothetical protein